MKTAASAAARPLAPPLVATRGRVRLRTLLVTRWIGIAGQAAALVIVRYGLAYPLPIGWAAAVVGASAVLNLWLTSRRRGSALLSDRLAAAQLGYDLLQLAALLYLTGGLANPFAILILAPVIVSATVLSRRSTIFGESICWYVRLRISSNTLPGRSQQRTQTTTLLLWTSMPAQRG